MLKLLSESLFADICGMIAAAIGDLQLQLRSSVSVPKDFGLASHLQKTKNHFSASFDQLHNLPS